MSYNEKSAWISLISILLVSAFYFLNAPYTLRPAPSPGMFHTLIICIAALAVIEVAGHIVAAILTSKDASAPLDERERLIELKAIRLAAYVYAFGSLTAVVSIHIGTNAIAVGYGVLLAFVIAELVNYGAQIFFYRHGV